ncbi:MAG: hypothetical protein GWN67_13880 [Phycisphaerae bacterium]|nr:hypothetical protein [Phycisphaerae bacterium]NIP50779.1 hypothetical protein [Phycisphaerae bacterium]NIS49943.1 hypothetical protein [Phycisphaerae bacterium]NIU07647.1 hypothetical protein [Phycisphaerae bacterium]NIU57429.1 hypothetical protein [Phycisphaerae bacterium]
MSETKLLLNAYYEALYERLEIQKELLIAKIEQILQTEFENRNFGSITQERYNAYRDACLAFIDERKEMYNPIGIQYTFDNIRRKQAFELELQLNFYDSRAEFEALVEAAQNKLQARTDKQELLELADELINEVGAFPDKSIISAYEAEPALNKLPDYITARAIEEIITST